MANLTDINYNTHKVHEDGDILERSPWSEKNLFFLRDKRWFKLRSGLAGSPTAELCVGGDDEVMLNVLGCRLTY